MKNCFFGFHPVINFSYFALVITISMLCMQPIMLAISLLSSVTYAIYLGGKQAWLFQLRYMLPMLVLVMIINPLFSQAGSTVLFTLGNTSITMEAIVYGGAASIMLISVLLWFSCYNRIITSDKCLYLFGKTIPAISLILSMVFRFVPRYNAQLKKITYAQKCIGRDVHTGSIRQRVGNAVAILSVMTSWALEDSITTADSMRARGYGLPSRSSYSIYRFALRDKVVLSILMVCGFSVVWGMIFSLQVQYYPTLEFGVFTPLHGLLYTTYGILCLLPVAIDVWEDAKWKRLQSMA